MVFSHFGLYDELKLFKKKNLFCFFLYQMTKVPCLHLPRVLLPQVYNPYFYIKPHPRSLF